MAAGETMRRVKKNSSRMSNTLPSSESIRHYDWCRGIHGAARNRRGIKRGTSAARRRNDKEVIKQSETEE